MRESFVFHAEYIEDLPEEFKPTYAMYVINYGIHGTAPELTGIEKALWLKIQRRIDADIKQWNDTVNARSEAGKKHSGNQYTRKQKEAEPAEKMEQMEQCSKSVEQMEQAGTNGTVFESEFVSESESVLECESESVSVCANPLVENSPKKQTFDEITELNYGKTIFDLVYLLNSRAKHKLAVNFSQFAFENKECREFLEAARGIHSNDQLQAIRNLYKVLSLDNPRYYPKSWKQFCLNIPEYFPGNFELDKYKALTNSGKQSGAESEAEKKARQLEAVNKELANAS